MKRKMIAGILTAALMLLSACGTEEGAGDAVLLEPHSLETGGATGSGETSSTAGSGGATGENGGSGENAAGVNGGAGGTAAAANGGSGSAMAGTGNGSGSAAGTGGSSSKENGAAGNASGGAGNGANASASGTSAASAQETLLANIDAGARAAAESLSDTDRAVYLQAVKESEGDYNYYSLIWLDEDAIPELVIEDNYFMEYSIYTVKDNALFCMADSLYTVEMTYYEKRGVIASFSRWNGGGDEGGYGRAYDQVSRDRTLTEDGQSVLSYSYNATYNEKGEYTGTGVTDYFYMGQEISETAYQEKLKSLGIAEGEDRSCMENSCSKEEMIALLSQ